MQASTSKVKTGLDLVVLALFSYMLLRPSLFLLSNYYKDVMQAVFENSPHDYLEASLKNRALETGFKVFKILLILVPVWVISVWYDYFTDQKQKTTRFLVSSIPATLYRSLQNNRAFVASLDYRVRVILALLMAVFIIAEWLLLQSTPVSYDELFSYSLFSSKGAWTSLSYYPAPNNHVLYNVVTSLFVKLPIDNEMTIRFAALMASVFMVYYLFKLLCMEFGGIAALIILTFFLCLYPIQLFSFCARGYAFINLCTVLLLYAIVRMTHSPGGSSYRWLFILSGAAGVVSVPSFLYAVIPIYLMYGLYLMINRQSIFSWIGDCFLSAVLVLASYSFIYLLNPAQNLINPNGGTTKFSLSDTHVADIITGHLKNVSSYLFLNSYTLFGMYGLMIFAIGYSLIKSKQVTLPVVISFIMILSPLLILSVHRVLPFERNWLYLSIPFAVCVGFLIKSFLNFFRERDVFLQQYDLKPKLACISLALLIFSYTRFDNVHHFESKIDYEIASIRRTYVDAEISSIQHIAFTNKEMEYYTAEFIRFLCFKQAPKKQVLLTRLDSIHGQDILVIHNSEEARFKTSLSEYVLLRHFDEDFSVYHKNPLK